MPNAHHWVSWLTLWGITDPCNREAFGAEIYPALKVNNIWRKLLQHNASSGISPYHLCADTSLLPVEVTSRNYRLSPDEVTNEPV